MMNNDGFKGGEAYPGFKNILTELDESLDPDLKKGDEYFQKLFHYFFYRTKYCESNCDMCEKQKSLNELNGGAYILFVVGMFNNKKIKQEDFFRLLDIIQQHNVGDKLKQ